MGQEMIVDVTKLNYMYNIPLNGKFNFINPQPKGCYMYMLKQLKWRSHGSLFMCFLQMRSGIAPVWPSTLCAVLER